MGLGLHDEHGITLAGVQSIHEADLVFAEFYTSTLAEGSISRLSSSTGKKIEILGRAAVEDGTHILEQARNKRVCLLVAGDPMTATTHIELRLRAIKQGSKTEVIGGVSVLVAVPGLLGLQHYKFARTVTLPLPQEGYAPTSPYDSIRENLERGLHTLVLLDIDSENGKYMSANEGLRQLLDLEARIGKRILTKDTLACVVARAGSPDCMIKSGRIGDVIEMDFGEPLHSLVIPGRLHFMELDALKTLADLDPSWKESH